MVNNTIKKAKDRRFWYGLMVLCIFIIVIGIVEKNICNFIIFLDLFSFSSPSTPSPDNDENVTEDDEDKL